jgi:hypothetical protein
MADRSPMIQPETTFEESGKSQLHAPAPSHLWLPIGIGAVTLFLTVRLFHFIDHYAVDVLFWDQWDFWGGLFDGTDPWALWRWQHGPHRQGLGGLVVASTAWLTGWNVRAEVFVSGAIMVLAALAALAVVRRERGRWVASDAVLPVLFLSLSQWELFAATPNPAHGPLPLLLVMLFALGLQMRSPRAGLAVLVATDFAATQTGFGVFLGPIAPIVFAARLASAVRRRSHVLAHAVALVASLGSLVLFFRGYVFSPAVGCFRFPDPHPVRYLSFLGTLFLRPFEIRGGSAVLVFGFALALASAGLPAWAAWRMFAARERDRLADVTFAFASFSLLFAANSAVGRVCVGHADSSRYIPYLTPFLVAMYLALSAGGRPARARSALLAALCALLVGKEALGMRDNLADAANFANGKRRWRDCYLATSDVAGCSVSFQIYPEPAATHLEEKLRFLRERRLSFFR